MQLYVILRRNYWRSPEELQASAARSAEEGDKPGSGVRWIRSYVIQEESGELGTVCIYEGESPEAIRAHAAATIRRCWRAVRHGWKVAVSSTAPTVPSGSSSSA